MKSEPGSFWTWSGARVDFVIAPPARSLRILLLEVVPNAAPVRQSHKARLRTSGQYEYRIARSNLQAVLPPTHQERFRWLTKIGDAELGRVQD
jgi:hypothetical protein